jgi:hypothetical protein
MIELAKMNEELGKLLEQRVLFDAQKWHLVAVRAAGAPSLTSYDSPEAMALAIAEISAQQAGLWVFAFRGTCLPVVGNLQAGVLDLQLPDRTIPVLRPAATDSQSQSFFRLGVLDGSEIPPMEPPAPPVAPAEQSPPPA